MRRKRVLITGANRGLGLELVKVFRSADWEVLEHTRAISDLAQVSSPAALDTFGGLELDLLINNAAIYANEFFTTMSEKDFEKTITVNLLAPALLIKKLWPALKARKGMVVNINSMAGKHGASGEVAYCASKFGLRGLSEALQYDATADGIRILSVYPGAMKTDMTKKRLDWDDLINPAEVAEIIYQLCINRPSLRITEIDFSRRIY